MESRTALPPWSSSAPATGALSSLVCAVALEDLMVLPHLALAARLALDAF
jgi:hypothetical protein